MPRKATQKVEKPEKVETEPVPTKGKRGRKAETSEASHTSKVSEPVEQPVAETKSKGRKKVVVTEPTPTPEVSESTPKTRHLPTRETVEKEFADLVASIEEEIGKLRDSTGKTKGVKFLRTLNKRVKILRNHALRISKQRQTSTKRKNTNSGFLKPVQISKELASFTGWNHAEPRSRVEVTKYICDYVKKHDLQNPKDRRQIRVENDPKLKKLLSYDATATDSKPLTYYSLQTYLKNHFTSVPPPSVTPVAELPESEPVAEVPAKKSKRRS